MAVIMRSAAVITGSAFPEPGYTSMWWRPGTAGGSVADATDILARFRSVWESLKTLISPSVTFDYEGLCIAVEDTTGVLTGAFSGTDPTSTVGSGTGDPLPRQTQGLIQWQTSTVVNGRRLRGRTYVPGFGESENSSTAVPFASTVTAMVTAGALVLPAGATASFPVIWHRPGPGGPGTSAAITGVSASTKWAVLRSRR